jgi:hypothetical protein
MTIKVDDSADEIIIRNDKHQLTSNLEDDEKGDDDLEDMNVVKSSTNVPVSETDASQPPQDHGNTADTVVLDASEELPQIHRNSNEYGIRNGTDDVGDGCATTVPTTTTVASTGEDKLGNGS